MTPLGAIAGYDGRAVANLILDQCDLGGRQVTNLALQKIMYFCHVWSLIDLRRPLVRHRFEAWELGPVLPYVYREFRSFDRSPITSRASILDTQTGRRTQAIYDFDDQSSELLTKVVSFYSRLGASSLVTLSHVAGGPWDRVWNHAGIAVPGMLIDNDEIFGFYSKVSKPFSLQ